VADLVVILQERNERSQWQLGAWLAATLPVEPRFLPLVGETLAKATRKMSGRLVCIVDVVAVGLAGDEYMACMMKVVVPLRCIARPLTRSGRLEKAGFVIVVLEHQVYL